MAFKETCFQQTHQAVGSLFNLEWFPFEDESHSVFLVSYPRGNGCLSQYVRFRFQDLTDLGVFVFWF